MHTVEYTFATLLIYSFIFTMLFLHLRNKPLLDIHMLSRHSFVRNGIFLGFVSVFSMGILDLLKMQNVSDGRFVILIIAVLCYDLNTSLIVFLFVNSYILLIQSAHIYVSLITTGITIGMAFFYRQRVGTDKLRYAPLSLYVAVIGIVTTLVGALVSPSNPYVAQIKNNMAFGIILYVMAILGMVYLIQHERAVVAKIQDLNGIREDLESQNEEIKALYDSVRVAESTLKENYDVLDEYRWRLETSEKRYERVLEASSEGFFDYFPTTKVWVLSKRFCELLGYEYSMANQLARQFLEHIPLTYRNVEIYFENARVWPESKHVSMEIQISDKSGYLKWYLFNALADIDSENRLIRVTGSILDINQRKIEQEKVEFYAFHDPGTGFLNADYFVETMQKYMLTSNSNMMVMYIGISKFEKLSQVYGKKVMDILQYQLGNEIKALYSRISIFSHMKPGTFGVLFLQKERYFEVIEKGVSELTAKFGKTYHLLNVDVQCDLMFPYYEYNGNEAVEVILDRLEETRLYCEEVHVFGRLKPFEWDYYNQKMFQKEISVFLKTALMDDLFDVYYQPKWTLDDDTYRVDSLEALVRLSHPVYGTISPDVFIKLAESLGEIHKIDYLVLKKSVAFSKRMNQEGIKGIGIAINASFIDLLNTEHIQSMIDMIGLAREQGTNIAIEITETSIANYIDEVRDSLSAFQRAEIDIHLDDFGTGYSSLSHLAELPINTVKIDRSFIDGMMENAKVLSLVDLTLKMGRQMNFKVVAEGIETQEQEMVLRSLGCKHFQGYYFAKPMQQDRLIDFLKIQNDLV